MNHFRLGLIVLVVAFAIDSMADEQPLKQHFSQKLITVDGYQAEIFLPDGWSVDVDRHAVVPGDASLSSCQVRFAIRPDQKYDEGVAAGIRDDKQRADRAFQSEFLRVSGAEAVWVTYIDRSINRIAKLYVRLPEGLLLWQFAAPNTFAGRGCEVTFRSIARESDFKRLE